MNGSGFVSMQEALQYESSYGSLFWVVIAVTAVIYLYTNLSFSTNGAKEKLERGGDIYKAYCRRRVDAFFECFAALIC